MIFPQQLKMPDKYRYLLAAALAGFLFIPANPPFNQGYFAWFSLLPLLWASSQVTPKKAFFLGLISGLPIHLYLNFYLRHVFFTYLPFPLALATLIALVLYISCFNGFFSLAFNLVNRFKTRWITALSAPALWLLMEYARSQTFLAYNVGYLGYTQWNYTALLQIVSLYGYWGLPFIMVLLQTTILFAFSSRRNKSAVIICVSVLILLLAAGFTLPGLFSTVYTGTKIPVALIQGNISPRQVLTENRSDILTEHLQMTQQAYQTDPSIKLVIWPETVVSLDFSNKKTHLPAIKHTADKLDISLLYGAKIRENNNLFNAITIYNPDQITMPVYHKQHLVPFVEYFPLESLLNRALQLDLLLGRYIPGDQITIFHLDDVKIAGVICFESYFGNHTRQFARAGAEHLFVLTNDAWFDRSIGLDLHANIAAIRAAEMGIGVTQVANSGITISFDYRGKELFRTNKMEKAIITYNLDLAGRKTVYTKLGDYFPLFWAFFLVVTIPYSWFKEKNNVKIKNP